MPRIIGLAGRIGSGKTLCAEHLISEGFTRRAYGDALKRGVAEIFGLPVNKFYGSQEARAFIDPYWGVSYREMLQKFGTEAIRNTFGEDFWERSLWQEFALSGQLPEGGLVIDDCRFPNEAQAVLDRGGIVIEILRPSTAPPPRTWWEKLFGLRKGHRSEWPLPDHLVTARIENVASVEQLHSALKRAAGMADAQVGTLRYMDEK